MAPLTATLGEFASDLGVSAGYALMFLVLTFLMCDLSHRYGVSVLVLCGMQELTAAFRLLGHQVPTAMSHGALPAFVDDSFVSMALTIAVAVASIALLFGKELPGKWGASFFGVGTMAAESEEHGLLAQRCAALCEAHNLSPREREVFALCAKGRDSAYICNALYISAHTVKSHIYHIYGKMDIHSQQELISLVEDRADDLRAEGR